MKFTIIAALFCACATQSACASDYPDCEIVEDVDVHFSRLDQPDHLTITVSGSPCYEATLTISVTTPDGELLYQYQAPFKRHTAVQWDDPSLDKDAERLVDRLLGDESFGLTSDLPVWLSEDDYYEANYQVLQIDQDYYEALRESRWVTFSHPIHYEGWKVVAFDRNKNETIVVSEGGL